jgi:hypothetical protein
VDYNQEGVIPMPVAPRRHPLWIYTRLLARLRWAAGLIAAICTGLWVFAAEIGKSDYFLAQALASLPAQMVLVAAAVVFWVLFIYTWVGPKLAFVQCFPNHLLIAAPFYRMALSYKRVRAVRPVSFSPPKLSSVQREALAPLLGNTALAIDLTSYPISEKWLQLWFSRFMFQEKGMGLLLLTRDWMGLSMDIESQRSRYKTHQTAPRLPGNPFAR